MIDTIIDRINIAYAALKSGADEIAAARKSSPDPKIYIGMATCGRAAGAAEIDGIIRGLLSELDVKADIIHTGCIGHCYAEPIVIVDDPRHGFPPIMYYNVTPGKANLIVRAYIGRGDPLYEHLLGAMTENELIPSVMGFPRFGMEERLVTEHCGHIDPEDIQEYISLGGYSSLARALVMDPIKIIDELKKSGLRGRGGAGFPSWKKLDVAGSAQSEKKIIICNADEGDPGAYMDRTIIESNPHQLLEGMAIAARSIGASSGIIYIRHEYPLAVKIMRKALDDAAGLNLLGNSILGSDFSLDLEIFQGSGAFVCGEETALILSVEGHRGMPRMRPPFPAEKGLGGKPTVINNVKTLSTIPAIIKNGGEWFSKIGTSDSPGTAIFSIVGNVVHAGLVEIPMGVSLRRLIFDICGGIPNQKKFKAVQIGGPSGGCLPEIFLDIPIDFDSILEAGAMMGSGGMVVMDGDTCMVDVARYFLEFTQRESCGKCTFCRIGTKHLLTILEKITKGEGAMSDLDTLESLSKEIRRGSLCGLGKTAPNPVLTTLQYFRSEYIAHIEEKRCPALKCRALTAFYIDLDKCARGCDACVGSCPVECIFTAKGRKKGIDQSVCVKCGECVTACPKEYDAVKRISPAWKVPIVEKIKESH